MNTKRLKHLETKLKPKSKKQFVITWDSSDKKKYPPKRDVEMIKIILE